MATRALSGVKVLDLGHYVAGPLCAKLLANLGADVVKVERPLVGDGARSVGPFKGDDPHSEKSGLFLALNVSKRGITLNLKSRAGVSILEDLVRDADVLVENFAPRVMRRLGLSYNHLRKINPKLVMTSISNFGQTGPYRGYKASELVDLALSGMLYTVGDYDREPLQVGYHMSQISAGLMASTATLASLYARKHTGRGDRLDVSIMECGVAMAFRPAVLYSYTGMILRRKPKHVSGDLCNAAFATKDGHVNPLVYGYADWDAFAAVLDCPELIDSRFETYAGRTQHMAELEPLLRSAFAKEASKFDLYHRGQEAGLNFGPVQTTQDLLDCPQLKERGFWEELKHPIAGKFKYPGTPLRSNGMVWDTTCAAPLLGQHNVEILCGQFGYSKRDLVRLRQEGVI